MDRQRSTPRALPAVLVLALTALASRQINGQFQNFGNPEPAQVDGQDVVQPGRSISPPFELLAGDQHFHYANITFEDHPFFDANIVVDVLSGDADLEVRGPVQRPDGTPIEGAPLIHRASLHHTGSEMVFLSRNDLDSAGPGIYVIVVHGFTDDSEYVLSLEQSFQERKPPAEEQAVLEDIFNKCCTGSGCQDLKHYVSASGFGPHNFCNGRFQACDADGHIIAMRFPAHVLECEFPSSIANLKFLERLDLEDNYITGDIGTIFETLKDLPLHSIHMARNGLTGQLPCLPRDDEPLSALAFINLSFNQIASTIPECFLTPMQQIINLSGNLLRGSIPELQASESMRHFDVSYQNGDEKIAAPLPDFTVWPNLGYISLAGNGISGPFPVLPDNIRIIRLQHNQIDDRVPELGNFPRLTLFDMQNNLLSGPLPLTLPDTLQALQLGRNQLTGPIPSMEWFGNLEGPRGLKEIRLGGNQLSGLVPPELGALPRLWALNLTDNNFQGSLEAFVEGIRPGNKIAQLELANNQLTGPLPSDISNLYMLQGDFDPPPPRQFYQAPIFDLSNNQLEGEMPVVLLQDAADERRKLKFDISNNLFECPREFLDFFDTTSFLFAFELATGGLAATTCIDRSGASILLAQDQERLKNGDYVWSDTLQEFVPNVDREPGLDAWDYNDEDLIPDEDTGLIPDGEQAAQGVSGKEVISAEDSEQQLVAPNTASNDSPEDFLTKERQNAFRDDGKISETPDAPVGQIQQQPSEEQPAGGPNIVAIVVAVLVCVCIFALLVVFGVIWYRKRSGMAYRNYEDGSPHKTTIIAVEDIEVPYGRSQEPEITLAMAERVNAALDPEAQATSEMK